MGLGFNPAHIKLIIAIGQVEAYDPSSGVPFEHLSAVSQLVRFESRKGMSMYLYSATAANEYEFSSIVALKEVHHRFPSDSLLAEIKDRHHALQTP